MAEALLFVAFALVAIASPFVLYVLARDETKRTSTMTRAQAERMVRRDTRDDAGGDRDAGSGQRSAPDDGAAGRRGNDRR